MVEGAPPQPLRVLIADGRLADLERVAQVVATLGHKVIAREVELTAVGAATARLAPDIALVSLGVSSEHALGLIKRIVHESACPVIALLAAEEPGFVREAAKRGVFAYIVNSSAEELQGAIDITLQRFAEFRDLQGAFGRRAVIEQAKGILMARHGIDAGQAFTRLREHSQRSGRTVGDLAAAVVDSHTLVASPTSGDAA